MDLAPMPLVCGEPRLGRPEGAECVESEDCARGLCVVAGTCVVPCLRDTDCRPTDRCRPVHGRTGPTSLQPLRACVAFVSAPRDVAVQRQEFDSVLTGSSFGDPLRFDGGDGTTLLVVESVPAQDLLVLGLTTLGPSPTVLFDLDTFGFSVPLNTVQPFGQPLTFLLPNGPRAVLSSAGYEARLVAEAPGRLDVTRLTRVGRGEVLDFDFFYVGARGFAPVDDELPSIARTALAELEANLTPLGLRVGVVRQHEVVGTLRTRFGIIEEGPDGDTPELNDLYALSAGAPGPSVAVFFVRSIDGALGIAGGIPGPQAMHGTAGSGIAIAADTIGDPGSPVDTTVGRAMTHELGHFLGLFHTSEVDGTIIEPLPDTPECDASHDVDGDGFIVPSECIDAGADNIMFWAASGDIISDDQRAVLRRAIVLR